LIFVTIGSGIKGAKGLEFTRLIKKMDEVALNINEEVIMQIGSVTYEPRNAKYFRYTSYQENLSYFQMASLVIGHCGIGTILNALRFQKPIIVVPRRIEFGELTRDDHQVEIARRLEGKGLIEVVYEVEDLEFAVKRALEKESKAIKGEASPERAKLIKTIKGFVERCR
jgi:UDP-N-acetylglucosamine transferase subunit ALG13